MKRKQLKAIRRAKAIRKKRNVRTNNMSVNPWRNDGPKPFGPGVLYI